MPRISEINPETAPEAIQKIIADLLAGYSGPRYVGQC